MPRASELFRVCERVGIDVAVAIETFHAPAAAAFDPSRPATWLRELRGSTPTAAVADRAGVSSTQARRWLNGTSQPRTHQLLALVEAMTGRAADLVGCLIDLEHVPSLARYWHGVVAQRRLAVEHPWTAAIRIWLETRSATRKEVVPRLARALGIGIESVEANLQRLLDAELVQERDGVLTVVGEMTVDLRNTDDRQSLRSHWAATAAQRISEGRSDLFSFSLVAVSRSDLERIQQLQRRYWRELRSVVAASRDPEVAALVLAQIAPFDD